MGRILGAVALCGCLLVGAARAATAVSVRGITASTFPGFSRVTVDLSGPAKPAVAYFPAEADTGRPERIALDYLRREGFGIATWPGRDRKGSKGWRSPDGLPQEDWK